MNYENYTNGKIQTYNKKNLFKSLIKTITLHLGSKFNNKKYPNMNYILINHGKGIEKQIKMMWVAK